MDVTYSTPLAMLTVGQLDDYLSSRLSGTSNQTTTRRYVYGLEGICSLFHCGLSKAEKLKNTIIKDAVSQHGRKILVDVDLAMDLYAKSTKK